MHGGTGGIEGLAGLESTECHDDNGWITEGCQGRSTSASFSSGAALGVLRTSGDAASCVLTFDDSESDRGCTRRLKTSET